MVDDFVFAKVWANGGNCDVFFIHGLTGDPISTWSNNESKEAEGPFWPSWLAKDIPNANIYTIGYPANIFARWAKKEMSLHEQAYETLEFLAGYEFGKRPIAIVAHSLGGLITKQLLRVGLESNDEGWSNVAKSIERVIFLATPHTGSSLADILSFFASDVVSDFTAALKQGSDVLDDLNNSYRSIATQRNIKTISYYEKHKTGKLAFVVSKSDADCGLGVPLPVAANHLEICKPLARTSQVYLGVHRHLKSLVTGISGAPVPTQSDKIERDVGLTHLLQRVFTKSWLEGQVGSAGASEISSKFEAGIFDKMSSTRKSRLAGSWKGIERQNLGPDGEPIEYPVSLDLNWAGDRSHGHFRFTWSKGGVVIVDETLPVEGGFYDGFLLLNFQDTISGKLQFGSLFLELNNEGTELKGVDVGVGYKTKKIVTGDLVLRKEP
jgi:pimeloyl-ACP methyl ester carboxylesterase